MPSAKKLRQLKKKFTPTQEIWTLTFTDGTTVQTAMALAAHDRLFKQLRDKTGSITTKDNQVLDFANLVHFDWQLKTK